jgi:hypothetical protein
VTRKEAIKTLHELWRETNDSWYEEVFRMAIEALSELSGDLSTDAASSIENSNQNSEEIIRNEKREENNNVHKMPLYAYASWDRSEE